MAALCSFCLQPEYNVPHPPAAGSNKGVALALFLFAFGSFLLSLGLLFRFEVIPVREENPVRGEASGFPMPLVTMLFAH